MAPPAAVSGRAAGLPRLLARERIVHEAEGEHPERVDADRERLRLEHVAGAQALQQRQRDQGEEAGGQREHAEWARQQAIAIVELHMPALAQGAQQRRGEQHGGSQSEDERQRVHPLKLAARTDAAAFGQGAVAAPATLGSSESAVALTPNAPRSPLSA